MDSGECVVAPSTPKPPARLTAATTSRQWLKASRGKSIPSISQIGDFMAVFTPGGSICCCFFGFTAIADDASASWAVVPSGAASGRPHYQERAFHGAEYSIAIFVSCAFARPGECCFKIREKIKGARKLCQPCNRCRARATWDQPKPVT